VLRFRPERHQTTQEEFVLDLEAGEFLYMASNRDRIDTIEARLSEIDKRLEELDQLPSAPAKRPKRSKFRPSNLMEWAQVVGAAVTILSIACSFAYFVGGLMMDNRISHALAPIDSHLDAMDGDIKAIRATLDAWKPFIAPEVLKNSTSLSREEFKKALPRLNSAMQELTNVKATIPAQTASGIAEKLRSTPESSPDYWPTVLRFIQLASASVVRPADLPSPDAPYSEMHNFTCSGFAHCMEASGRNILLDGGSIPNSTFDHCRIKFTNNPVNLKGTRFIDCIFEMPASEVPSPYLKKSAQTLLASNLSQVTFSE